MDIEALQWASPEEVYRLLEAGCVAKVMSSVELARELLRTQQPVVRFNWGTATAHQVF